MGAIEGPPRPSWEDLLTASSYCFVAALVRRFGVRGRQDVEDLVHEVLLAAREGLPRYDPRVPVRAWLTGVVRNVVRDWRKGAHHRHVPAPREEVEMLHGPSGQNPETAAAAHEREQVLERLMDEIEWENRAALVMQIEGAEVAAISKALEIPKTTVKWRLRVGKRQLEAAVRRERARHPETWTSLFGVVPFDLSAFREIPDAPPSGWDRVRARLDRAPSVPAPKREAPEVHAPGRGMFRRAAGALARQVPGAIAGGVLAFVLLRGVPAPVPAAPPVPPVASALPSADRELAPFGGVATAEPVPAAPTLSPAPTAVPAPRPPGSGAAVFAGAGEPEKWLIDAARADLRGGHPREALRWLDEHATKFPQGALAVERERLRGQAEAASQVSTP
jgi:RNA polymerase sigma factor (sigma-70 family)